MEAVLTFLQKAWGVLPFELIIVLGLVVALVLVSRYFIKEIHKLEERIERKDKQNEKMVGVLMESSNVMTELTTTIQQQNKEMEHSTDRLLAALATKAEEVKNHISTVILRKGE